MGKRPGDAIRPVIWRLCGFRPWKVVELASILDREPRALRRQIEDSGGLKLIYIDPPFDVGADFSMDIEIGGETFHKEPNLLEQIAYRDTWGRGADSFISMIYERLILMRDLMADDGSVYVHCDWRVD